MNGGGLGVEGGAMKWEERNATRLKRGACRGKEGEEKEKGTKIGPEGWKRPKQLRQSP